MRVRDGVYTFDLNRPPKEPLSVHIIETDNATVLFGGGHETTVEELVDIATEYQPDVVVAEHGDIDHYGSIPGLRETMEIETAVPAGDEDDPESYGIEFDHLLNPEGQYWGVTTISTPGHTPNNMAFLYKDILIAGDTVVGSGSDYAADDDWTGPLAVIDAEWSVDDVLARKSVENLLDYEFEIVLVTHGTNVLKDGKEAVRTLVDDLHR